ncbi:hypothetical protein D9756_006399 [Leucocoprinus leucothites]|uniref:Mitochondrial ribosomal protein L27 n=1 Tax=Leucocoprinus leucothites TaxID=201217 RepID=A0A8H5LH41_9AGAR|nr:hypothetical protein D9756_006399 [Leucoagaricus leucothites]
MFATLVRCSKASRKPLTPKRGNKDYYKGTRQAFLPGGHRTGAPGKHVIGGKAKYRLVDEKVRVFVAPPISEIESTPLRPYVSRNVHLAKAEKRGVLGKLPPGGLQGPQLLELARARMAADATASKSDFNALPS